MQEALGPLLQRMTVHGGISVGLQMRMNPQTAQVRPEDWRHMVGCARKILQSRDVDMHDVRWVIATDLPAVMESLAVELGEDAIVWWDAAQDDGTGRMIIPANSSSADLKQFVAEQLKRAVDHYLLSLADVSVISFASTFGLTAAMMHPGKSLHYSFGRHYHQKVAPKCERSPCGGKYTSKSSAHGACLDKAFGYFDVCSSNIVYGHGEDFLSMTAEMNERADDEPFLDDELASAQEEQAEAENSLDNSNENEIKNPQAPSKRRFGA
jgi:hypothetical protein